jgi:hypothetical protein
MVESGGMGHQGPMGSPPDKGDLAGFVPSSSEILNPPTPLVRGLLPLPNNLFHTLDP